MRETVRWPMAFHEAGHIVAAWRRGLKVHSATIVPSADFLGNIQHANPLRGIHLDWDGSARARRRAEAAIVVASHGLGRFQRRPLCHPNGPKEPLGSLRTAIWGQQGS
jgi:hypothetical protein